MFKGNKKKNRPHFKNFENDSFFDLIITTSPIHSSVKKLLSNMFSFERPRSKRIFEKNFLNGFWRTRIS